MYILLDKMYILCMYIGIHACIPVYIYIDIYIIDMFDKMYTGTSGRFG